MNEKHVILQGGDVIAIVENEMLASHFAKFLPDCEVEPISNFDWNYDKIRAFLGEK